jgi:hypothetical protein
VKTEKCRCCNGSGTHRVARDLITALYEDRRLSAHDAHLLAKSLQAGVDRIGEPSRFDPDRHPDSVKAPIGSESLPVRPFGESCCPPISTFTSVEIVR